MRSFLALLLLFALPVFGQSVPSVGREGAASDPVLLPAVGEQGPPSLATNGDSFFVAWQDSRLNGAIFGARIDASGRLLDPTGILLSDLPGDLTRVQVDINAFPLEGLRSPPQVAWSGSEYVVVWSSARGVRATRVTSSGDIVQRDVELVGPGASRTSIASNGKATYLLYSLEGKRYLRTLSPTLQASGPDLDKGADPAGDAQRYVVATDSSYAIFAMNQNQRVWQEKVISDGRSFVSLINQLYYSYFTVLIQLDANGNTLKSVGFIHDDHLDEVVWTGSEYHAIAGHLTVLRLDRDLNILWRKPAEAGTTFLDYGYHNPVRPRQTVAAVSNGVNTLLVGIRDRDRTLGVTQDLYASFADEGRRTRAARGYAAEILVAQSADSQTHPAAASNDKLLLAAWYEPKENQLISRVLAARVTADGQHIDGRGIVLSETGTPVPGVPVVGSDGDGFLVIWDESDGYRIAQHFSADGSAQTRTRFPAEGLWVTCRDVRQSIAFDGSNYLLVSQCGRGARGPVAVLPAHAIRLSRDGVPIGGLFPLSVVPGYDPKVVWTGSDFFVTREDRFNDGVCGTVTAFRPATQSSAPNGLITVNGQTFSFGPGVVFSGGTISLGANLCLRNLVVSQGQILQATVTSSAPSKIIGTFVLSSGVIRKDLIVASGSTAKTQAAVATNGRTIFAIWKEGPQDTPGDLYGRIFSLDGEVLRGAAADTPGILLTAGVNSAHPSVAWDGAQYVLAWESTPAGSTTSDLLIRHFREDGSTPDSAPVVLSATPFTDDHVQLVPFGTALAAVYTREAIEPQYGGVSRVFLRRVQ